MLQEIRIQNYAVVESLGLEFHPGLIVLSGETGSGKSILVDALSLALGGRATPDVIRTGSDRAAVTAVFRDAGERSWERWLEELGLPGGDELILRREVLANGKSRLLVNDQPITLAAAKQLARLLVEVHGQNEHVVLFARDAQLDLLDQFAGLEETVEKVRELYRHERRLAEQLEALSGNEQERLRTIDLLSFQLRELDQAKLQPGEDAKLEDEKRILVNLEKLRAAASAAFSQLYEDEGSACARLALVSKGLEDLRRYDAAPEPYLESFGTARAALEDLAYFLRDYLERLQADPGHLEEVEDRLALIERLKRKYGDTIQAIFAYREQISQQLLSLEHSDERREELRGEVEKARDEYRLAAEALSTQRRAAARKLEKFLRDELSQLGMEKTRFEVHFQPLPAADQVSARAGASGFDEVEFRISPNPGEELRPLDRIASGGELSRLMLALKTIVGRARSERPPAARRGTPVFIFDEVDSGIGGRVAEYVGQRLKRLASDAQVLCVTHLPQIACFADHHYYVEKVERAGRTITTVKYLETQKDRAQELARMLSGSQITDAVLKHAAAMLKQAAAS